MNLTIREEQIISLIAAGMRNDEIALCMGVSIRTVHAHLSNIYNKLGVSNRSAALVSYIKKGGNPFKSVA